MHEESWLEHKAAVAKGSVQGLRSLFDQKLMADDSGTVEIGFLQGTEQEAQFERIEDFFICLPGELAIIINNLDVKDIIMEEEKQERKLFELSMEFLECVEFEDTMKGTEMIEAGVPVNFQDPETGMAALHFAAAQSRAFVRILVNTGECDYLLKDRWNRIPYDLAAHHTLDLGIRKLLMKKAGQQAKKEGYTNFLDFRRKNPYRNPESLEI